MSNATNAIIVKPEPNEHIEEDVLRLAKLYVELDPQEREFMLQAGRRMAGLPEKSMEPDTAMRFEESWQEFLAYQAQFI